MSNMQLTFIKSGDPLQIVCAGDKPWRLLAECDHQGQLAGNCWIRTPDYYVIEGHLSDYRRLRGTVPREVYIALRDLKNTFHAEQAGQLGHA